LEPIHLGHLFAKVETEGPYCGNSRGLRKSLGKLMPYPRLVSLILATFSFFLTLHNYVFIRQVQVRMAKDSARQSLPKIPKWALGSRESTLSPQTWLVVSATFHFCGRRRLSSTKASQPLGRLASFIYKSKTHI
jgi:hypothetical protein